MRKPKKRFIVDVRLGSKYVSGISFTVEKVHRMSILVLQSKSTFSKSKNCHWSSCFLCWFNEEGVICFQIFCCYYKLSHKNTKPKANNGLILNCKLWTILAHCYNVFIAYSVFHLTFLTFICSEKENVNNKENKTCSNMLYFHCW